MALTNCPECKSEVSSTADECPHCGYDLRGGCLKAGESLEQTGCCGTMLLTIPIIILVLLLL